MITHDLLIASVELAGMRAALEAGKNVDVALISKVHPLRPHSGAAQGGIAAVLDGRYWKVDESALKLLFKTSSY